MAEEDTMAKETKEKESKVEATKITIEDLVSAFNLLKAQTDAQIAFLKEHTHNAITGKPDVPLALI